MSAKRLQLSDQIRQAIDDSGLSRYAICKQIGLAEATMSRFMNRQGGLSIEILDRIGELLELELVSKNNPAKDKDR